MTAWVYLGIVLAACGGMLATYIKGGDDREAQLRATQLEQSLYRMDMESKVEEAVAKHVGAIKVEHKTYIRNFKETERENTIYSECQHSDDAFSLLNSALSGDGIQAKPVVPSELPD